MPKRQKPARRVEERPILQLPLYRDPDLRERENDNATKEEPPRGVVVVDFYI
jgi:hypothetical protein